MMKTRALALMMLAGISAPALAESASPAPADCAPQELRENERISIAHGAWRVECMKGSGCAVLSPEVAGQRLQLARQVDEKGWQVLLTLPEAADAGEGIELAIDGKAAERIPPEFLESRADGRVLAVRPEVAGVVLDMLKGGARQVEWRYMSKAGKGERASFTLGCFAPALHAAEREIARMRAMRQIGK